MRKPLTLLFALASFAQAGNLVLIDRRHTSYRIVLVSNGAEPDQFAAQELAEYLKQIGNVALPANGSRGTALHVGERNADVDHALAGRRVDSFTILTSGPDVYLTGNTPRATLYAVYYFFEKFLGCGWLQPGDDAVPKREVVSMPDFIHEVEEPAFVHRSVNLYPYFPSRSIPRVDWAAKTRLNWIHFCTNGSNHWDAFDSRNTFLPEVRKRGLRLNYGGHTFTPGSRQRSISRRILITTVPSTASGIPRSSKSRVRK